MNILKIGNRTVGHVDDDGQVYASSGGSEYVIGQVQSDGAVLDSDGNRVGTVEMSGTVCNDQGTIIGHAKEDGTVTRQGRRFGHATGDKPLNAAGALALLFDWPQSYIHYSPPDEQPQLDVPWYIVLALAMMSLLVIGIALIFVAATIYIWGGMLLITCVTANYIALKQAYCCSDNDLDNMTITQIISKRGTRDVISSASIDSLLSPWTIRFLTLAPGLWYGLVILTIESWTPSTGSQTANTVLFGIAYIIGAVVSAIGGSRLHRSRVNRLLLARLANHSTGDALVTHPPMDWAKLTQISAATLGLTGLLFLVGTQRPHGIAVAAPSSNTASNVPGSSSVKPSTPSSIPSSSPDVNTTSQPVQETRNEAEAEGAARHEPQQKLDTDSQPDTPTSGRQTSNANLDKLISSVSDHNIGDNDLKDRSPWELSLMRNGPYARHGYRFHSHKLQDYFDKQSWYHGATTNMADVYNMLSQTERTNTKYILDYQKQHGLMDERKP